MPRTVASIISTGFFQALMGSRRLLPSLRPKLIIMGNRCRISPSLGHPRFPRMPNGPFQIDAPPINVPPDRVVLNPVHAYYQNIDQINGGKNNKFAAVSNVGGWTMGYYDGSRFRLWQWAREYTLADNFFMGAFGGSYLNHL